MKKQAAPLPALFRYKAINKAGKQVYGDISAKSLACAKVSLMDQELVIIRVSKKKNLWSKDKKVKSMDITGFSRQLATLISSGIPLIHSLDIAAKGLNHIKLKNLIYYIKQDIESGSTLAESLSKHPIYFNKLLCNLVAAGEQSGTLDLMLDKIANYKEQMERLKNKIKKVLTYPLAVLLIGIMVSVGILIFVIPQFEAVFKDFNAELPAMTKGVITLSQLLQHNWYIIFGALGILIYTFFYLKKHSVHVARLFDWSLLKLPLIGAIVKKSAIARFARTLAVTFGAGLPLVNALESVAGATGTLIYAEATTNIKEELCKGQSMNHAMEATGLFPNMVVQMIAVGEESGTLEKMLDKVADFYEEDVDQIIDNLDNLLEPIIMSLLGLLVGGLVIAMYMPIFKLGSIM
jgi:type IV pilus assembly protein PilC